MTELNKRLDSALESVSENKIIKAIRQGLLYNMPLIMVGCFVIMVLNLPVEAVNNALNAIFGDNWRALGLLIHKGTFRIMSMSTLLSVTYALVNDYSGARVVSHSTIIALLTALASFVVFSPDTEAVISEGYVGTTGMFRAIVVAIVATKLYTFFVTHMPRRRKMFTYDSDAILQFSLGNIVPVLLTIFCFALVRVLLDIFGISNWSKELIVWLNGTLFSDGHSVWTAVLYCVITHILWFFGIHGTNVMEGVAQDIFVNATDINTALVAAGNAPTEILTKEFFDVFVFLGGAGCTLGLLVALFLVGRSSRANGIARYSVFPGIFNINEAIVYGLPLIFNPHYLVPFMLTPIVLALTSFGAFALGIVPLTSAQVVWTTPIFISGYISTGSVSGLLLQLFNLAISVLLYLPFVRMYERQLVRNNKRIFKQITDEYNSSDPDNPPLLLQSNDEVGVITRALAMELRAAIGDRSGGLYMAFQPKCRGDGRVFGAEALLRWAHPVYGDISPMVVLGIANEAEIGPELEAWILEESFSKLNEWEKSGISLTLSVNLAPKQIKENLNLTSQLVSIIERHNLSPQNMELEITEHAAMDQGDTTRRQLEKIKELGIGISVDDFGMGSSSLMYLRDFFANIVKLDISLVHTISTNNYSQEIVRSIMSLCSQLGAGVVAEGVETQEQIDALREFGCDQFQGWYFSKALRSEDFVSYVLDHGTAGHLDGRLDTDEN